MRPTTVPLLVLLGTTAILAAVQPPPVPGHAVTDEVGFLAPATRAALDAKLERLEGAQVAVWIGALPEGVAVEEWSVKTFEAWGLGRKGRDDGVAIFVFPELRTIRIEVGYGLEGLLTDAIADRIIRERFAPAARAGEPDRAVTETVDAVLATLGLAPAAPPPPVAAPESWPAWKLAAGAIAAILFLILAVTHPRLAFFLLLNIVGQGHRNGRGGGFRGGGGRSGGGGATGTW